MNSIKRIRQLKTKQLYTISALFFVAIVATYAYGFNRLSGQHTPTNLVLNEAGSKTIIPDTKEPASSEEAREIAQAQKPNTSVTKVETVREPDGDTAYTVHFEDGTKMEISVEETQSEPAATEPPEQIPPEPTTQEPAPSEPEPTPPSEPPAADETGSQQDPTASSIEQTPSEEPM